MEDEKKNTKNWKKQILKLHIKMKKYHRDWDLKESEEKVNGKRKVMEEAKM